MKTHPLPRRFRAELREIILDLLPDILDRYFPGNAWSPAMFNKTRRGLIVYPDGMYADLAASEYGDVLVLLARERGESNVGPALLDVLAFIARELDDEFAGGLLAELDRLDHARRTLPVAPIVERYERNGRRYAVVRCPFCKRLHSHGDDYGPRGAHCIAPVNNGEYCIDEVAK
ncbi:MAG: hypothetical protein QM472_07880 [Spirochaetota bacterium]|nr:hypothetical protein [Spirochaetota bacterium]